MTDQLKIRCSGCQKTLKIPAKYRGKKIKCPNCSTVLQAGKKPTAESASHNPTAFVPPDISLPQDLPLEEVTPSLLEPTLEDSLLEPQTAQSPQPDPFADLGNAAPVANVARSHQNISRRDALNRGQQKSKQRDEELDETDQRLQSAGVFMICLPIIASFLPLMGLQLRRLARAGV
jgi:phage FluMu protein Com